VCVFSAVVGAPDTPTPTGLFAVSERISQPDPHGFYGPWVLLLTAYSNTLQHFDGGPGQISIHAATAQACATHSAPPAHTAASASNTPPSGCSPESRPREEGTPVIINA
jgi:hypothetical protein